MGRIVELLAVDSLQRVDVRPGTDVALDYHSVRIIYRTEIVGGDLRARDRREHRPGRVVSPRPNSARCRSSSSAASVSSSHSRHPEHWSPRCASRSATATRGAGS